MTHVDELIRRRYALGALSTGTHALYQSLGWELWRGPTFVDGPRGRERTPDGDGGVDDPSDTALTAPRSRRIPGLRLAHGRRLVAGGAAPVFYCVASADPLELRA